MSPTIALLRLDTSDLGPLAYRAGQFAQLQVPGTTAWRNYSYAHPADRGSEVEFIVRLPSGSMSDYLRDRAKPGDRIAMRASKGGFHLRPVVRPLVLVAGGTGISAILAMAQSLEPGIDLPVHLVYGVTNAGGCANSTNSASYSAPAALRVHPIVSNADPSWDGSVGQVTDALHPEMFGGGDADVYLCGPAGMVEATRNWLTDNGIHGTGLYYEKFVPSGSARRRSAPRLDYTTVDVADLRSRGRGPRWSSGQHRRIAAAKVLTEKFDRVIVLEKDARTPAARAGRVRPRAGICTTCSRRDVSNWSGSSPGSSTTWCARARSTSTWPPSTVSGSGFVEEAGHRRHPDRSAPRARCSSGVSGAGSTPNRGSPSAMTPRVADLVYDRSGDAIIGVAVAGDSDELDVVPAEFVVDASGKEHPRAGDPGPPRDRFA